MAGALVLPAPRPVAHLSLSSRQGDSGGEEPEEQKTTGENSAANSEPERQPTGRKVRLDEQSGQLQAQVSSVAG